MLWTPSFGSEALVPLPVALSPYRSNPVALRPFPKGKAMMEKQSTMLSRTSIFCGACLFSTVVALSQTPAAPKEHELTEIDEDYVDTSGTLTRCGKYFLLESKTYGELEVKQVHLCYAIADGGVALSSKNYRDLEVVIDDTKSEPALLLKWENPGLEKDRLELSEALYQKAKVCLPPPSEGEAT